MRVHNNVFLKGETLVIGWIESNEEKRLFSLLTRLTLSCLIKTVIDEETLALRHEFLAVLLEPEVILIVYHILHDKTEKKVVSINFFYTVIWCILYSNMGIYLQQFLENQAEKTNHLSHFS